MKLEIKFGFESVGQFFIASLSSHGDEVTR